VFFRGSFLSLTNLILAEGVSKAVTATGLGTPGVTGRSVLIAHSAFVQKYQSVQS
jgi:hypothetical protein